MIKVNVPLIGIDTYAKDEEDAKAAVVEAVILFCIAAEQFGDGIEEELRRIGREA